MSARITLTDLAKRKLAGEKITCLTCYDASLAACCQQAEVDILLIGDSLGMVVQGHQSTHPVTLDDLIYHLRAVARGAGIPMLMADLPFMTYATVDTALSSAAALVRAGAQVVKLEGGAPQLPKVRRLAEEGIAVCAHLGLLPQSLHRIGGYRVQGRGEDAERLVEDALSLQQAGANMLLLECVPASLAETLSVQLDIPVIGIGAGPACHAQVLVIYDLLGLTAAPAPKFVRNFMTGAASIQEALRAYVAAVKSGTFPGVEETYF